MAIQEFWMRFIETFVMDENTKSGQNYNTVLKTTGHMDWEPDGRKCPNSKSTGHWRQASVNLQP